MNRFFLFPFILFFVESLLVSGQVCELSIRGRVFDEAGGPLAMAGVQTDGADVTVMTDVNGNFLLPNLCAGTYKVVVHYVGYDTERVAVTLPTTEEVLVIMTPSRTMLDDVVIEGVKAGGNASQTSAVIGKEALGALHGKPLGESLKEIPGVSALQTGPAIFKPVIHGLHSQRILILNNGIRQEGQQWGIEHAPEIDPYIASEIEVLKGAESVRYGAAAMGGVIIITPPPLHETEKTGGELNLGMMSNNRMLVFSGLVEGNLGKGSPWGWRLQSSVKKGGDYHAPDYNLSNTGQRELNFSGAMGYRDNRRGLELYTSSFNTSLGILRASHTGNLSDLQQSIVSERPWYIEDFTYDIGAPRQEINHHLVKLSAYQQVKGLGKVTAVYGGQFNRRQEFDIRKTSRQGRPSLSMSLISNVVDLSLDHSHSAHSGSVGLNATAKINVNDTGETGVRPLLPDYRLISGGAFVLEKLKRGKWTWEAGARYDLQYLQVLTFVDNETLVRPEFVFHYLSGTLGATHLFSPSFRLVSNLSLSTRPPDVNELYSEGLHHGTASIEEGIMRAGGEVLTDAALINKEHSRKWISSLQFTNAKVSADLSGHVNAISNYVYVSPVGTRLTIRGYFPVFQYRQTDALLAGADAAFRWEVNPRLTFRNKLSYLYATDTRNNDVLIFIPPAQIENSIAYTFPAVGKIEDLTLTLSAPVTFRQSRAARVTYPADITSQSTAGIFDFAPAPDTYTLLNASVGFRVPVQDRDLSVTLTGENLLNTSYRNYINRLRYYADDTGTNFIVRISYDLLSH